jgi:hypothetical protein
MASTANLTLSGIQTIDTVVGATYDRVAVKDQTDPTENGIWEMRTGAWVRAADWDDNSDVQSGMLVLIGAEGSAHGNGVFQVQFTGSFVVGTTSITFTTASLIDAAASASAAAASAAAAATSETNAATSETNAAASAAAALASESAAFASASNASLSEGNSATSSFASAASATAAATSATNAAASATAAQASADSVDTSLIVAEVLAEGAIDAVLNGYSIDDFAYVADVADLSADIPVGDLSQIHFSDDGLRFYALDDNTDTIFQYRLDSEWDLSTINTPAETSFAIPRQLSGDKVHGWCFGSSGQYLYWSEEDTFSTNFRIGRIDLNTAWDLRAGYGTVTTATPTRAGTDMYISVDGSALYMKELTANSYGKYAMPTAWSLSGLGAATDGTTFPVISGPVSAVVQSQSLSRLLAMEGPTTEQALIFSHPVPFLPDEVQYLGSKFITAITDNGSACEGNYGKSLFVVGTSNAHIHKFSMEGPFTTSAVHTSHTVYPKAQGNGVQIDQAAPAYAWHDLLGDIIAKDSGAGSPSIVAWKGGIKQVRFAVGDSEDVAFHIPHDWVPGHDCFIHIHWSVLDASTDTYTFEMELTYGDGHNQGPCVANITTSVAQAAPGVAHQILVSEVQLTAASPSASQLDSALMEPDGTVFCDVRLLSKSGAGSDPFIHHVDLHYKSTGIGTVAKAPDFWT